MAEFDDDMLLSQLRNLLRNRSAGNTLRPNPDEFNRSVDNTPRPNPDEFNRSVYNTPRPKYDEFKANDLPEFSGGTDPEVYLDWERTIERLFDFKELTDKKRCKYAILRLSKGASLWYEGEKKKRVRAGKEKITSWESLKRKLRKRFVPTTHKIATYREIAELKQGRSSIGGHIDEFEGLSLFKPSVQTEGSSASANTSSQASTPIAIPKQPDASKETSLSKMRCFKCQGFGHIQSTCPNKRIVTLREALDLKEELKLVVRALQTKTTTDEVKQRDQHSTSNPDDLSDLVITSASVSGAYPVVPASLIWGHATDPVTTNPLLTPEQTDMGFMLPSSSSPATSVEMLSPAPLLPQPQHFQQGRQEVAGFNGGIDLTAMNEEFVLQSDESSFGFLSSASTISLRASNLRPLSVACLRLSTIGSDVFGFRLREFVRLQGIPKTIVSGQDAEFLNCFWDTVVRDKETENGNCRGWAEEEPPGVLSPYSVSHRILGSSDSSVRITHCGAGYADVGWMRIDGFFCEDRNERSDRNKTRRLTKFIFEERKKVEQNCEAVRTHRADVRSEFKEEPPPSGPFGPRHLRPSAFGSGAFGYHRGSAISAISFRSSVFTRHQCTPGVYATAIFNDGDLAPYFVEDDLPELRSIPFKGGGYDANRIAEDPKHHDQESGGGALQNRAPWMAGFVCLLSYQASVLDGFGWLRLRPRLGSGLGVLQNRVFGLQPSAFSLLPSVFCLRPSAFGLRLSGFDCLRMSVFGFGLLSSASVNFSGLSFSSLFSV